MTHEQNKDLYAEDFFDSVDKLDKLTKKNQYIVTAVLMLLCAAAIITSLDKGTQPFVVCDG